MRVTTKIAVLAFAGGIVVFVEVGPVHAQWTGGPVLIGGDDTDDHFESTVSPFQWLGRLYMREGFNFLGEHVTNGNTMAVCIGCNGDPDSVSRTAFRLAFDNSDLPGMPVTPWTRELLTDLVALQAFFDNTGSVKIQDTGIVYLPTFIVGLRGSTGITQEQLDVVNANADANPNSEPAHLSLRDYVKDFGGGLFTHTMNEAVNPYLVAQRPGPRACSYS